MQNLNDDFIVYESAICNEYVSDLARELDESSTPLSKETVWKLKPTSPSDSARMRLLNDHIDSQISPAQFTFLMNKDVEKDEELKENLEKALLFLEEILGSNGGGPYFMGKDFSLADIHFLPFYLRLRVSLKHFKDYDITVHPKFLNLEKWFQLCSEKDSVKAASKTDEEIISVYDKFVKADYKFGGLNKN